MLTRQLYRANLINKRLTIRQQQYLSSGLHRNALSHVRNLSDNKKTLETHHCKHISSPGPAASLPTSNLSSSKFWIHNQTWQRAALNTMRCLIGCTLGDFSCMWYLQTYYSVLGIGPIMLLSMSAGICSSMILETVLLHRGRDKLPLSAAFRTATGMSLISMITMEVAENAVDYHLTSGIVNLESGQFWLAAGLSITAGFLAPLPYNYFTLRRYNRSCD